MAESIAAIGATAHASAMRGKRASDSGHHVRPVPVCCRAKLSQIGSQGETMEVNGIAHIFLTASNFERSREFYRELLPFLGMTPVIDTEAIYYCVGGRTAVGISAPSAEHEEIGRAHV